MVSFTDHFVVIGLFLDYTGLFWQMCRILRPQEFKEWRFIIGLLYTSLCIGFFLGYIGLFWQMCRILRPQEFKERRFVINFFYLSLSKIPL